MRCVEDDPTIEFSDSQMEEKAKTGLTMGEMLLYDTIWKMSTGRKHPAGILLWRKGKVSKKESFPI